MRPQKQKYRHNPAEGTWGDCHRTCIACLLDMDRDDVPHWGVHYGDDDKFKKAATEFLASVGYKEVWIGYNDMPFNEVMEWMGKNNPGIHYMLCGASKNGTNHVVICKDDRIVWDTSLDNSGIVGPIVGMTHYEVSFLVPLNPRPMSVDSSWSQMKKDVA